MEIDRSSEDLMDIFYKKKFIKVCAPMVRYSKLQFRTLVREYNCDLCFTPMILADSFCMSEKARNNEFSTNLGDTPLVVQYAANTVHDFVGAAHMVSPYCHGVDLNCGCPQRWAKAQGIGCIMLDEPEIIFDIVRQCRNRINKPFTVSVKMRILPDLKKSVTICQQLENCGVNFLTIHGRTANQQSVGEVNVDALKLIVDSTQIPIISNGGVRTLKDATDMHEQTKCRGVMVASGILTNPTLFTGTSLTTLDCVKNWLNICYNSTLNVNSIYSSNNITSSELIDYKIDKRNSNLTFQCFHHHLVFMLEKLLPKQTRKIFNNLQTFDGVLEFLSKTYNIQPEVFDFKKLQLYNRQSLNYENRKDMYLELKNFTELNNDNDNLYYDPIYNSDLTDGNFFNSKKKLNDYSDTCISSLFLDD